MTARDSSRLSTDSVHVWSVPLTQSAARAGQLASLLSTEEKERAGRLRIPSDRRRFVVAHGVLRSLIAHYLDVDQREIRFEHAAHGKPGIASDLHPAGLEFNYSRSADLALYAFARGRAVGIDVERIQPLPDITEVARALFSPEEKASLFALPEAEQLAAFYRCWTRKEAYLKATGKGLVTDLGRFTVSLAPGEPARLLSVEGNTEQAVRWSLQSLEPDDGYVGALAVEGHDWHLVHRRWTWDAGS